MHTGHRSLTCRTRVDSQRHKNTNRLFFFLYFFLCEIEISYIALEHFDRNSVLPIYFPNPYVAKYIDHNYSFL